MHEIRFSTRSTDQIYNMQWFVFIIKTYNAFDPVLLKVNMAFYSMEVESL